MSDAMTEEDDNEMQQPKVEAVPRHPLQADAAQIEAAVAKHASTSMAIPAQPKTMVSAHQGGVMALVPRNLDEAWKMADAFRAAGMVPDSLRGKDDNETKAKLMLAICKGAELGYGPVTAVGTIMVINGKACIYGDGATALVQNSGKVDWIKTEIVSATGKWADGYKVTVSLKRKDQSEPYIRSFSFEDAKRARLIAKKGPWTDYPERQCYWRAASWAYRDGASDALMGLQVAEEVSDYAMEAARTRTTDTSDLDPPQNPKEEPNATAQ